MTAVSHTYPCASSLISIYFCGNNGRIRGTDM